jgi:subfamily B ATP-binding cassette protein MsbA
VGKSTVVLLLTRLYSLEEGVVTANGTPIDQFDLGAWRERVSMVRQDPFIFNETVRYNLTVSNRDATEREIRWACRVAQVTELLDDPPGGWTRRSVMTGSDSPAASAGGSRSPEHS